MKSPSELWLKHRPKTFDEVVGQDAVVKLLRGYIAKKSVPHAVMLTGSTGAGKTTLAGLLADAMGCKGGWDRKEIDCAIVDPLATIREIDIDRRMSPSSASTCRVWILEEAQAFSRAKNAQQAMLRMLENDGGSAAHSYFFLCTSDDSKILKEIRNRCKKIEVKILTTKNMELLLRSIAKKENRELPEAVLNAIVELARGVPREAVNQLDTALTIDPPTEEAMLAALSSRKDDDVTWRLFKALLYEQYPDWKKVAEILAEITDDHEVIRHRILGHVSSELLKAAERKKNDFRTERAYQIADYFMSPFYDKSECGLVVACYGVVRSTH